MLREDIKKYRDKSYYILKTLDDWGHLAQPGTESNNLERVIRTNNNNFNALDNAYFTNETIGKLTFWAIKRTVDMNYNTVKSWEARTVPEKSKE